MLRATQRMILAFSVWFAGAASPLCAASGLAARAWQESPGKANAGAQSAQDLLKEGFQLYNRLQLDKARPLFELALTQARAEKNTHAEAEALRGLGYILSDQGHYAAARKELEQALALYQTLSDRRGAARCYNSLAGVAYAMGDFERAQELYKKAQAEFEAVGDLQAKAHVLVNRTFLPNATDPLALLEEALGLARQLGDKRLEGKVLHSWGDQHFSSGEFSAAMEKLERAARLFEQTDSRANLARVLTSMGRVQRAHGHPQQAIPFYRRALKIQEEIGDKEGIVQSLNAIAVTYNLMEDYREAGEHFERALAVARETGSSRYIDFLRGGLAGNYISLGEYARAAELLEDIIRQGADVRPDFRYTQLAEAYFGLGRAQPALDAANKAVQLTRAAGNLENLSRPLSMRARVELKLGQTAAALDDVREALGVVEQLRARSVPTDFMKRGFAEQYQGLFSQAIELHQQMAQPERALEVAEQARARALLDVLATRDVQVKANQPTLASLHQVETELKARGVDPSEASSGATPPLTTRGSGAEVAELWKKWHGSDPELLSLVSVQPLSSSQIAGMAARLHSTLLSYWVAQDALYVWVVPPKGPIRCERVDISKKRLTELVQDTWTMSRQVRKRGTEDAKEDAPATTAESSESSSPATLTTRGGDSLVLNAMPKDAWRQLYKVLIRPVRSALPAAHDSRLTIIPHGPLSQLSFAALLDEKDRYLVERFALHYVPASAVLQFTGKKKQVETKQSEGYLFVADPTPPTPPANDRPLPRLPGAREEVKAIIRLLPPGTVTLLTDAQANERRVRDLAQHKTVVHFATHAIVRDDNPLDSFLALGGTAAADSDDGRLTAQEIYSLNLNANLVVLSACRTGRGKPSGDGIANLARAFFYAGTPSLVVTLWDVADEPSGRLLPEFYRSLQRGRDKGEALRSAQLRLLSELRAGRVRVNTPAGRFVLPEHPFFWAGFALLGEP